MCFPIAERPVLFRYFHQVDEDILLAQARFLMEQVGDALIQRLPDLQRAAGAQGDLDDHQIVRAMDVQILQVVDEVGFGMFGDDLEAVLRGDGDGLHQGTVNG